LFRIKANLTLTPYIQYEKASRAPAGSGISCNCPDKQGRNGFFARGGKRPVFEGPYPGKKEVSIPDNQFLCDE
jgi:hypothetical protein